MAEHGTVGRYDDGCRCKDCKQANAIRKGSSKQRQFEERIKVGGVWFHPYAPHGTLNGYQYYGCRCDECSQAARDANNKRKGH